MQMIAYQQKGIAMQVTRFAEARAYKAPNHVDMRCLRLQGHEVSRTDTLWLGLSHLLPGGHTGLDASAVEKLYLVVAGEVTVVTDSGEATLGPLDSCRLAPGERRRLENRTNHPALIVLAMPYAAGAGPRS